MSDEAKQPSERDAAIFLPALGAEWTDQSIETMARRMAVALERSAVASAKFVAKLGSQNETYGDGLKASMATISRVDGAEELPLLDLYGFDFHRSLTTDFQERNLFTKAALLVLMILYSTGRLIGSVTRSREAEDGRRGRAKQPREVVQLLFGVGILLLFCAYAGIVVYALVKTATQFRAFQTGHPGASIAQAAVVVAAAVGLSLPKVRDAISNASIDYLSVTTYLAFGARRPRISGQFESLLEHLAEHSAPRYARVHVIGYSFGSIVALDTLYPRGTAPSPRCEQVRTLVTIGCPFDMVRTYWRDYFHGRERPQGSRKWWNVYNPQDILGSNFRDDDQRGVGPTKGLGLSSGGQDIRPDENIVYNPSGEMGLSILGLFMLEGLRAHTAYWDEDVDSESCLTAVMGRLYAGTKALA